MYVRISRSVHVPVNTIVRAHERTFFENFYYDVSKLFIFNESHVLEKQIQLKSQVTDEKGFKAELHIFYKIQSF